MIDDERRALDMDLDEEIRATEASLAEASAEREVERRPRVPGERRWPLIGAFAFFALGLLGFALCDLAENGIKVEPFATLMGALPAAVWSIRSYCWLWLPIALVSLFGFFLVWERNR